MLTYIIVTNVNPFSCLNIHRAKLFRLFTLLSEFKDIVECGHSRATGLVEMLLFVCTINDRKPICSWTGTATVYPDL